MLLSQFPFTFHHHIHNGMHRFIALLMLIVTVFVIIGEMFHGSAAASEFCE